MYWVSLFQWASPERREWESLSVSQMFERVGSLHDVGDCRLPLFVCIPWGMKPWVSHIYAAGMYVCVHMCTGSPWLQRQSWLAHWGLWGVRAVPGPCCNFLSAWQDLPRLGQQRLAVEHATNQGLNLSPHWPCVCTTLPPILNAYVFGCVRMIDCVRNIMCITQIMNPSFWQTNI